LVNILQLLVKEGGRAAFVGKPCDVAALRQLATIDSSVREHVVYYLSFFCAGVPSQYGTMQILDTFGISAEDVEEFQYRGRGWPGNTTAKCKDGRSFEMDYATSWGTILNRHLQFRCKICPDGIGEFADISCADAWYSEDGYPDFKEKEGRSLIITRTRQGEDLVNQAMSSRTIEADGVDIADITKMQPYQVYRKQGIFPRLLAMRILGRETPVFRGLGLFVSSTRGGAVSFLKHFAGMGLRLLKKSKRSSYEK
jgi:coenzyme F420 hydrogenase subunit beta